jgi:hypothetical protein
MNLVSLTGYGAVWEYFSETTLTFHQGSGESMFFLDDLFVRVFFFLLGGT